MTAYRPVPSAGLPAYSGAAKADRATAFHELMATRRTIRDFARNAGIATLTHTPSPMGFLRDLLGRPKSERAVMIVVTGHTAPDATVPQAALRK